MLMMSSFDEHGTRPNDPDIGGYIKNVLQSVEVIVKDPAYRTQLQRSTGLLTQLVMMLNNLDDEEAKIILIKLLGILGHNLENKVLIGKNDGFKKLLALMLHQNEGLLKGIIDTFKQLLDIGAEREAEGLASTTAAQKYSVTGDIGTLSPEEIRDIFEKEEGCVSPGEKPAWRQPPLSGHERPSYQVLRRLSFELKNANATNGAEGGRSSLGQREESDTETLGQGQRQRQKQKEEDRRGRMTCVTLFRNYKAEKDHPFEESKADALAEEMVIQGTLNTVCEILLTTRRELQIDLMQIIAKLLVKSRHNQIEFQCVLGSLM
jgi:hypothetical protein